MAKISAEILTDSGFLIDFRGQKSPKGTLYKLPIQVIAFETEANLGFLCMESGSKFEIMKKKINSGMRYQLHKVAQHAKC